MTQTLTLEPLRIGNLTIDSPVVLAPMAGITNTAFRRLCREYGQGLYVSEMITSRALVERTDTSLRLIKHHESETLRSIQLYGVDPYYMGEAVKYLVDNDLADHIDMNFGCPVPKVTRKGGGAALPWKHDLFTSIVKAAVREAGDIPVTVKMRKGIDDEHLTFLDAARAAEDAGVSAIALHGRTANQHYSGEADWASIRELKEAISSVPVLGNGDIWSGADAVRMMQETGCDGVVVGRGCLGRPWLFADLNAALQQQAGILTAEEAKAAQVKPLLGGVMEAIRRHTELLIEFFDGEEDRACRDIRKHIAWYLKGYGVGGDIRRLLAGVTSLEHMDEIFATMDPVVPYPEEAAEGPRGRAGRPKRTALPDGWLDSRETASVDFTELEEAERDDSGG